MAELRRVLRPDGLLVLSVHQHVLNLAPQRLQELTVAAGFTHVEVAVRARRFPSPAVELTARTDDGPDTADGSEPGGSNAP